MMIQNPFQDAEFNYGDLVYGVGQEKDAEIGMVVGRWIEEVDNDLLFHYTIQYADNTKVTWPQSDLRLHGNYRGVLRDWFWMIYAKPHTS